MKERLREAIEKNGEVGIRYSELKRYMGFEEYFRQEHLIPLLEEFGCDFRFEGEDVVITKTIRADIREGLEKLGYNDIGIKRCEDEDFKEVNEFLEDLGLTEAEARSDYLIEFADGFIGVMNDGTLTYYDCNGSLGSKPYFTNVKELLKEVKGNVKKGKR